MPVIRETKPAAQCQSGRQYREYIGFFIKVKIHPENHNYFLPYLVNLVVIQSMDND